MQIVTVSLHDLQLMLDKTAEKVIHAVFDINMKDKKPIDRWFDLAELENYLPEKLARPTLYSKLAKGEIPGHKKGKKWFFLQSEIDHYLKTGRKKTVAEIIGEVDSFLSNKKEAVK